MNGNKRRCPGCRHDLSSNAFPRGSQHCYACQDDRRKKETIQRMPRILFRLRDRLDEIERDNDWEHRFVAGLVERFEKGEIQHLTDKQFAKVDEIYRKYEQ